MPFAALVGSDGRFLIENVAITLVPSGSVWHELQSRGGGRVGSFLGLANPRLDREELFDLPEAKREVERIAQLLQRLDTTVLFAGDATETSLKDLGSGQGIVHLATTAISPSRA